MKLGLIYNKNAGNKQPRNLSRIVNSIGTSDINQVFHALDKLNLGKNDILGICGGDGTFQCTLTKCFGYYNGDMPSILLLKGGTINSVSDDLKLDGNIERAVYMINNNKYTAHIKPVLRLDSEQGTDFGFIYGSGFAYELVKAYNHGPVRGAPKLMLLAARMITDWNYLTNFMHKIKAEVLAYNGELSANFDEHNIMAISTIKNLGLGFEIMGLAGDNGKAHMKAGILRNEGLINNFFDFYAKDIKGIYSNPISSMKIKPISSLDYILDGEFKSLKGEMHLSLKKTKFIIPDRY